MGGWVGGVWVFEGSPRNMCTCMYMHTHIQAWKHICMHVKQDKHGCFHGGLHLQQSGDKFKYPK